MALPRLTLLLPVLLGLSLTACFGSDKEDEDDDDDDASSDGGGWDLGGSEDSGFTGDGGSDGGTDDGGTDDGGTDDGGTDSGSTGDDGDGGTGGDTPYDGEWTGLIELGAYLKGKSFGACIDSSAELEITDAASTSVLSCTWADGPLAGYPTDLALDLSIRDGGSVEGSGELDLAGIPVTMDLIGEAAPRALYIEAVGYMEEGGPPLEVYGTIEMSR